MNKIGQISLFLLIIMLLLVSVFTVLISKANSISKNLKEHYDSDFLEQENHYRELTIKLFSNNFVSVITNG